MPVAVVLTAGAARWMTMRPQRVGRVEVQLGGYFDQGAICR